MLDKVMIRMLIIPVSPFKIKSIIEKINLFSLLLTLNIVEYFAKTVMN